MLILFLIYSVLLLFKRVQDQTKAVFLGIGGLIMIFSSGINSSTIIRYQLIDSINDLIAIVNPRLGVETYKNIEPYQEAHKANSAVAPAPVPTELITQKNITQKFLAGNYYHGCILDSCYLNIKPEGIYDYRLVGYHGNYITSDGTANIQDGCLALVAKNVSDDPERWLVHLLKLHELIAINLIPVLWQGRTYLINPDEMINFCIAVNEGGEPRNVACGSYYLRRDDWHKHTAGLPNLPPPWNKLRFKDSPKQN
jgi:hypothetical protein